MQITPTWPIAVEAATLTEAFRDTAAQYPDVVAVRTIDDSVSITWGDLLRRVDALAGGLASLGVHRGDTVALMVGNRLEFHLADLAVAMLGATPFSIYLTSPAHEVAYLVRDAGARVAIVEQASLPGLREASGLEHVIVVDDDPSDGTLALAEVENADSSIDVAAAAAEIDPDDVLTLIYTSGTTGPPKGVQLSHRNVMAAARAVQQMIELPAGGRLISWLPSAHIAERMAHHYIPAIFAATITCCPDPREVLAYLPRVHPTWFFAVPRIWEKLKAGIEAGWATFPDVARDAALVAATERVRLIQRGEPVPADLQRRVGLADERVFAPLRRELGLDQALSTGVGAAPTPVEVVEFFHAIGIELAELWGMSETCGAGTCNRRGAVKIGTAGPPSPGVELKLAPDGEVLVRGDVVMLAYRGASARTAEVLEPDGWLRTGDIGTLDEDGYLRIVDRKKEIIINASGKNMSPANIEARLKASSPLIGQAVCIGDARPYNVALIILDADIRGGRRSDDADVLAEIDAAIVRANRQLARVEQIKRYTILGEDWAPGGDELTPTMKLKRRSIAAKYAAAIEAMYAPQAGSTSTGMPFRTALPDTRSMS